jgi:hypothetical protein
MQVTITPRDRRALLLLSLAVVLTLVLRFGVYGDRQPRVAAAAGSIPQAEKRLARLRQLAASVPGKQTVLKNVSAELAAREKGVIVTETAQQAQAQIQQILRKLAGDHGIEIRGGEFGQVRPLGADYGEAPVAVPFDCGIEQFINFLSAIGNQPELLGPTDVRIIAGNPKDKRVSVRLTVSGVVAKKLVPQKKGLVAF